MVFEIKSYAEEEDIERFNDKAELAVRKLNLKKMEKAFITLEKHPSFVKRCKQLGILVGYRKSESFKYSYHIKKLCLKKEH